MAFKSISVFLKVRTTLFPRIMSDVELEIAVREN